MIEDLLNKIHFGKWQNFIDKIFDKSIDMILIDPPYHVTKCEWDEKIDLDEMFDSFNRIIKDNGCICVFGNQPFTTDLINANRKFFKYELIWNKKNQRKFLCVK